MIGQKQIQEDINKLISKNKFPKFSMIVGSRGSGKKTLVTELFPAVIKLEDCTVDSIRKLIEMTYKLRDFVFLVADADNMSVTAQNAILKVAEECPNNNTIIMTLEDENNVLETIRSRAIIFRMNRYTPDEIFEYYWTIGSMPNDAEIVKELCETPGEVLMLDKAGIMSFYDYFKLVVDNITEVSLANVFKVPSKISLKVDTEGYDLKLFWKAFQKICMEQHPEWVLITSKYLRKLKVRVINRQMLIDCWLLEIRKWT